MTTKERYSAIEKIINDNEDYGLLGFVINDSVNDYGNSYDEIGGRLDWLIYRYPEHIGLIEEVITAICGYDFETLKEKMLEKKDYYDSL